MNNLEQQQKILKLETENKIQKITIKALNRSIVRKENEIERLTMLIELLNEENSKIKYVNNQLKCVNINKKNLMN